MHQQQKVMKKVSITHVACQQSHGISGRSCYDKKMTWVHNGVYMIENL